MSIRILIKKLQTRVVCAWCKRVMRRRWLPGSKAVSHGMCAACFERTCK